MQSDIEKYLNGEFREGKLRLRQIRECLVKISRLFNRGYISKCCGWDYEFDQDGSEKISASGDYSYSTQAMCALALSHLTSGTFWHEMNGDEQDLCGAIQEKKNNCVHYLYTTLEKNAEMNKKGEVKQPLWKSGTYGEEDPLTAAWIIELVSKEHHTITPMLSRRLQECVANALDNDFNKILGSDNRAGAHAFPVHRCVSAMSKISDNPDSWQTTKERCQHLLSGAGYWFEQELHKQLSHYQFKDFRFDAPELIYCLAGASQTGRIRKEDQLILDVLEVIRATQQDSVYWRPYRPFLVKCRGLVLMPLSVEVADALLATLELTHQFGQLKDSLSRYYKWLIGQGKHEDSDMIGWRSENAFGPPGVERIHTWTTSRVAMFLLNYSMLLDRALQNDLLSQSGLSIKDTEDLVVDWEDIHPMDLGRKNEKVEERIKPTIQKHFIDPNKSIIEKEKRLNPKGSFSVFLYGPPGTSKTSLAEGLAKTLDLKLVTITASDFIVLGVEAVEQRAKVIFEMLNESKNVVVLFDEIDRLITDRDSERYFQQGDILQLMTPSMLTKLNDLRRKKKLIFVISTNYFERIDKAIRRAGRIDQHILITPFDQKSRVELLRNFVCRSKNLDGKDKDGNLLAEYEKRLNQIAKCAPLLVFEELKRVFERSMSGVGQGGITTLLDNLDREIEQVKPSIAIGSYEKRLDDPNYSEKPYREYFFLCFLLAEVDQADKKIRESFQRRWKQWAMENEHEARELKSDKWVQKQLRKFVVTTGEN